MSRDPARLAAQVISGIGFLGAGTIIQTGTDIKGLTTATTLWIVVNWFSGWSVYCCLRDDIYDSYSC